MGAGLYLTFRNDAPQAVTAKVGLSYTSVEHAWENLAHEAAGLDFDAVHVRTGSGTSIWGVSRWKAPRRRTRSSSIRACTTPLLGRGLVNDVDGSYPRNDGSVGRFPPDGRPAYNLYNTDAAWGAQWNLAQLWALAYPEYLSDYVSTHLQAYRDAGWLADGLANNRYVSGVGTNLLSTIIAGAYQCGIRDFDTDTAYAACPEERTEGENRPFGAGKVNTSEFVKYGYVPPSGSG